jgi:hypothetical protein
VLSRPLPLPEKSSVLVTIQTEATADSERAGWLRVCEESLSKAWNNTDDDVFNDLLSKWRRPAADRRFPFPI